MAELGPTPCSTSTTGSIRPFRTKARTAARLAAEYNLSQFNRQLDGLEARLESREYLLGAFSLVDVAAASWLLLGTMFGLKLEQHPRVASWCKRCAERPAMKRAQ